MEVIRNISSLGAFQGLLQTPQPVIVQTPQSEKLWPEWWESGRVTGLLITVSRGELGTLLLVQECLIVSACLVTNQQVPTSQDTAQCTIMLDSNRFLSLFITEVDKMHFGLEHHDYVQFFTVLF